MKLKEIVDKLLLENTGNSTVNLMVTMGYSFSKFRGKENHKYYINFIGIEEQDVPKIRRKLPQKIAGCNRDKLTGKFKIYYIAPNLSDTMTINRTIGQVTNILSEFDKYEMPPMELIQQEMETVQKDKIDKAELKNQMKEQDDYFAKIITTLNDPKTQEILEKIGRIGLELSDEIYGVVRSPGNAIRTYAVKPNATYVVSRTGWSAYNRIVKAGAQPIYLQVPNVIDRSEAKANSELGVKMDDIFDNPHKLDAFKIKSTDSISGYSAQVFYDVSDTMVYPGFEDLWTYKPGLSDNLKGILNDFAKKERGVDDEAVNELNIENSEDRNALFTNKFLNYVEKRGNILSPSDITKFMSMDPTKDETVYSIIKTFFEKEAFIREHDENIKRAKVNAATIAVMISEKIANKIKYKLMKVYEDDITRTLTDRKQWVSISAPVNEIGRIIHNSLLEANYNVLFEYVSPEAIMKMFNVNPEDLNDSESQEGMGGIKNEDSEIINEQFYNIFKKLMR